MPLFGPEEGGGQTEIGWSRPKTVIFWPFLAFEGRLGGLKDPPEVRVEDKTCPGQKFGFGALLRPLRPLKWIVICPTDDH